MISVALIDDHVLLRNGLAGMLRESGYQVLFEADDGNEVASKVKASGPPDVALLDINMKHMNGYDTATWFKQNCPETKVLALSMYDDEENIIKMLKNGARGYILKDSHPTELKAAIEAVVTKGFYYSEMVTGRLMRSIIESGEEKDEQANLTGREIEFLKLAASELTYKEIAEQMNLSHRTIDGYRDDLFEKLNIKSRVGLVLYAIRNGIVKV
ncbi:MAG TPA: response regulator transcription factor [Chitinophagaceae bacterium]|nr:response regulator transcription factor [Chitinophagaceae bacterium]HRF17200.1 response regulator transcription factor [Chitinophagaceae bacterium]